MKKTIALFVFLLATYACCANTAIGAFPATGTIAVSPDTIYTLSADSVRPSDTVTVSGENMRFIAAVLAFPAPFGALGLHRIYLGTAPWVPVAYTATLGGFGLVSFADFVYIIFCSDEQFEDMKKNPKLFLWAK